MPDNLYSDGGAFIPSSYLWDIQDVKKLPEEEFRLLLVRLYQNVNSIALVLNIKDSAIYNTSQFVNGQLFFPNPALTSATPQTPEFRQVYRTVVNFGALPAAGTIQQPHGITCSITTSFTRIYGVATKPTATFEYIPIPYSSASTIADNLELSVDDTYVYITTGGFNYSAYTITYVVLEYIQT
jgi:hypothetical protein